MNLYHIKLTDNQKAALEYLFSLDVTWNKTELEKAWDELREQVRESAQCVAIINALRDTECNCKKPTKYDPNRLFRKGDIVEMDNHGRDIAASMKKAGVELGKRYTVTRDESTESNGRYSIGYVSFIGDDGIEHNSMFFWLKLVTPVEEIERYYIEHDTTGFAIVDRLNVGYVAHFKAVQHPHAKEAAEAERDRLNAEYRKEKSHD